ncbi:MAG: coproporphyrinogen dehydrogenase HemZ [Christensenellales bacterium]
MVYFYTKHPSLTHELGDVLRIFYPLGDVVPCEDASKRPLLMYAYENGVHEAHFFCDGKSFSHRYRHWEDTATQNDARIRTRNEKHAAKICVYRALEKAFGAAPWGALTGVRPTRLAKDLFMRYGRHAYALLTSEYGLRPDKTALLEQIIAVQEPFMRGIHEKSADVYIGIPFCRTRCAYCSFTSVALTKKRRQVQAYLEVLHEELRAGNGMFAEFGYDVRSIYVGGGTPTALLPDELDALMKAVVSFWPGCPELTVEAGRPDTITQEKLSVLQDYGVNRISINPQSMCDETLKRIGRDHTSEQTQEAFALARKMGFSHINMDVIAGLPGEGETHMRHTLRMIEQMDPESLTVHTLAIKRAAHMRRSSFDDLPDDACVETMIDMARASVQKMGMQPYYLYRQKNMRGNLENTGYCKPGHVCVYNIDIMEEATTVLALGAGAVTKRLYGEQDRIERQANPKDIGQYIERLEELLQKKRALLQ